MNGYSMMSESYRKVLERDRQKMDPEAVADMEKHIEVFDILSGFDEDMKHYAFDSSMYNDVLKGYVSKIIDELCEDDDEDIKKAAEKIKDRVNGKAASLLDRMNAKEAEDYYYGR